MTGPDEAPVRLNLEMFTKLPSAKNAHYRLSGSQVCVDSAHESVLHEIECWVKDLQGVPIFWLSGSARTGKSAIARTIAEKFFENGQLGATFFCSREDPDQRNPKLLFPTLATQLALERPEFLSELKKLYRSNPGGFDRLEMEVLILQPLGQSGIPKPLIFIIDGLDKFENEETVEEILSVLEKFTDIFRKRCLKFLITSRPEVYIRRKFRLMGSDVKTFSLKEVQ